MHKALWQSVCMTGILNTRLAICTLRDGKQFNLYGELHSEGKRQLDDKLFEITVFNHIDGSVQDCNLQCVSTTVLGWVIDK